MFVSCYFGFTKISFAWCIVVNFLANTSWKAIRWFKDYDVNLIILRNFTRWRRYYGNKWWQKILMLMFISLLIQRTAVPSAFFCISFSIVITDFSDDNILFNNILLLYVACICLVWFLCCNLLDVALGITYTVFVYNIMLLMICSDRYYS